MTGRSCNEVPVSLAIFQRAYRIIGWDALRAPSRGSLYPIEQ